MSNHKKLRAIEEQEELEALQALEELEQATDPVLATLDSFFADGIITEVLYEVKSGKEATVYCCRAHPSQGVPLVAAKIYRPRNNRGFKNDSVYQEGRLILDQRTRRAVKNKSEHGRAAQFSMWVGHEFATLSMLYKAGATIPRPLVQNEHAIIMEYVGDEQQAAPPLYMVTLKPEDVYPTFALLMDNIELCLKHNIIHGDLSAYNVLYWRDKPTIIDFPQAVDPRFNPHALNLLTRDIDNICKYIARFGLKRDAQQLAGRLWHQFKESAL